MAVPTNLVPTRISQLPEYGGVSTLGYLPYVLGGIAYRVQFANIAAVGAVPSSRTVTGGSGLTGGGDLSANRIISVASGGIGASQLDTTGVAAGSYGSATSSVIITVDANGRVTLASSATITPTGYVTTARTISAGDGLSGGGDLSANRTLSLIASSATPEALGSATQGTSTTASREDHVHPSVDLADISQTDGILPLVSGGTGNALSPIEGGIVYSSDTKFYISNPGTVGYVLTSTGPGAPTWNAPSSGGTVTSVAISGGTTGLTTSGGPIIASGTITFAGTLVVANGGTGATTAAGARTNVLPTYAGNSLKRLTVNIGETDVEWTADGGGTVTSVALSGGTTGLTVSGSPITTSGTITLAGTLAVANGGTGVTSSTGTGSVVLSASPTLTGTLTTAAISATQVDITAQGNLRLQDTTGGEYVALRSPSALSSSYTLTFPADDGTSGQVLATDGAGVLTWFSDFGGTVTSVALSGGTTGLTVSGSPITTSGTITLAGTLAVANGGTGATTAAGALISLGVTDTAAIYAVALG